MSANYDVIDGMTTFVSLSGRSVCVVNMYRNIYQYYMCSGINISRRCQFCDFTKDFFSKCYIPSAVPPMKSRKYLIDMVDSP